MAAGTDTGMQMQTMSWPQYVSLGRIHMQPGGHKLVQEHFQRYDRLGGIMTFNRELSLLGIETSSLIKHGMQLKEWCNDYTVHPLNAFGVEMAERVNRMTRQITASIVGEDSSFNKACLYLWENERPMVQDWFSGACRWILEDKKRFRFTASAITMAGIGMIGWKIGWRGERNVLILGSTGDDDGSGHVDGFGTDAYDDGDNKGNKDSEQPTGATCRMTLDESSSAHGAAKASPRWECGYISPRGEKVRTTPAGQTQYRVHVNNEVGWFRADQVVFPDGEVLGRHDLRKKVRVNVLV